MRTALIFAITLLFSLNANAYDRDAIVFGLGAADVSDDERDMVGNIEYRGAQMGILKNLSPMAGIEITDQSAVYGYAGLLYDWKVSEDFAIVPSFGVGLYHSGGGKDLGGALEFRSGIELDYLVSDRTRFGVRLSHKSNAGIYDKNPGTEELVALYSAGF